MAETGRQVGRPDEDAVDAVDRHDRIEVVERVARLDLHQHAQLVLRALHVVADAPEVRARIEPPMPRMPCGA